MKLRRDMHGLIRWPLSIYTSLTPSLSVELYLVSKVNFCNNKNIRNKQTKQNKATCKQPTPLLFSKSGVVHAEN